MHYTCDLSGRGRFGPDAEWIEIENYDVDPSRAEMFYGAIRRYWPGIAGRTLDQKRIRFLIEEGMVEITLNGHLCVTRSGFPVLDAVVADLAA